MRRAQDRACERSAQIFYLIKHIKSRKGKHFGHKWGSSLLTNNFYSLKILKFKYLLTKNMQNLIIIFFFFFINYHRFITVDE